MKFFLFLISMFSMVAFSQTEVSESGPSLIDLNPRLTYLMTEPNQELRKELVLLEERQKGYMDNQGLTLGTQLIAIGNYQKSNRNSKFGYLMRHPTSANQIGFEVSEAVIHSWKLSAVGSVNNWISAFAELMYDPQQSFGAGATITGLSRNQLQLRQGYVLFGDLNKLPLYFSLGKMNGPFGQQGSVSPFTNSTMWHAFAPVAYGAQLGIKTNNFNAVVMAVQGGAQFRSANTPVAGTNVPSRINNGIADVNYTFRFGDKSSFKFGGSYILGCAYCLEFPVMHFNACTEANPAYTVYGKFLVKERLQIQASWANTVNEWKGTYNPTPPLDIFLAAKVTALEAGAKYDFKIGDEVTYSLSVEFSNYIAGAPGSPWEFQNQYITGFSALIKRSSRLFIEGFRTEGFVPLNFLSGGNLPPGQTISDRGAKSHGVIVGAMLTF
ncbi:MAG: hypothetical protein AB8B74_10960 [Crocinitomicaceae bacterium]